MAGLDFFFDEQLRRYLEQCVRIFWGFKYEYTTRDGTKKLRQIPARWGDTSRMVSHIMRNNSENVINSTPFMTVYVDSMVYAPERRQQPSHEEKVKIYEREFDEETQSYTTEAGPQYVVERHMPVPWNMYIKLDVWTTNTDQKTQIFEQIATIFNPEIQIQSSVNPIDWTSLTYVELQDHTWTSRSIPVGTDSSIDIMSWRFYVPIWINPPAKVKKAVLIHQIITNILEDHECFGKGTDFIYDESDLLARIITTPGEHQVSIDGDEITLLFAGGNVLDINDNIANWKDLLDEYGNFREGITQFRLRRYAPNLDSEKDVIVGLIDLHPSEANKLLWAIDPMTLPANTIPAIDAVIDPHKTFPGAGLPVATANQRYLLLNNIGGTDGPGGEPGDTQAWGDLTADKDDIIEYNGTIWSVIFDASAATEREFVLNSFVGKQFEFEPNGEWVLAVDGTYLPGVWRLLF